MRLKHEDALSDMTRFWSRHSVFCGRPLPYDAVTEPFRDVSHGRLAVVAGPPSSGKSSLLIQIALRAATQRQRSLLCSSEMDVRTISARLVASATGIPASILRGNHAPRAVRGQADEVLRHLRQDGLAIATEAVRSVEDLGRALSREPEAKLVILDRMDALEEWPGFAGDEAEADEGAMLRVCEQLRDLAQEHDALILVSLGIPRPDFRLITFDDIPAPLFEAASFLSILAPEHLYVSPRRNDSEGRLIGGLTRLIVDSEEGYGESVVYLKFDTDALRFSERRFELEEASA